VWPSGAALAAALHPTTPPPPVRLSTSTGLPSDVVNSWPTMRATMSVLPPVAKGTITVIAFAG
jgi:hypothetical protein